MTAPTGTVCPQANQHTPEPSGYVAWFDWAGQMSRTHTQRKCPGCGRWEIWEPKPSEAMP